MANSLTAMCSISCSTSSNGRLAYIVINTYMYDININDTVSTILPFLLYTRQLVSGICVDKLRQYKTGKINIKHLHLLFKKCIQVYVRMLLCVHMRMNKHMHNTYRVDRYVRMFVCTHIRRIYICIPIDDTVT